MAVAMEVQSVGRVVDVDLLVDAIDLADLFGQPRTQVIHTWAARDPSFPRPIANFGGGQGTNLWYWPEVAAWGISHGRLPAGSQHEVPAELLSRPHPRAELPAASRRWPRKPGKAS